VAVRLKGALTSLKLSLHPDLYFGELCVDGALIMKRSPRMTTPNPLIDGMMRVARPAAAAQCANAPEGPAPSAQVAPSPGAFPVGSKVKSVEKNVRATWHYSAMTEIPEFAALLEEIVGSQHHRSFSVDWPFEELRRYSLLNRRIARRLQV
jgi:hypothetical protein